MRGKRILAALLAFVMAVPAVQMFPSQVEAAEETQTSLEENERQELNFNTNWLFVDTDDDGAREIDYDESQAEGVSLPHSLGEYDIFDPDPAQWQKITWYRRHFTIPAEEEGNRVIIYFDGGGQINNVYVNGAYVGTAKGTFTDFSFDITDYITFGEYDNVLAVEVDSNYHRDTLPPSNDDFHWMGGLHGDAWMEIVDPLSIESVFYWTEKTGEETYQEGDPVSLKGEIEVTNFYGEDYPVTIKTELRDKAGQLAAEGETTLQLAAGGTVTAELSMTVENPQLWDTENPNLYDVYTELQSDGVKLDSKETRTGLRWITSTGKTAKTTALTAEDDQQILLNDQPLKLYGINKNQQFVYIGNSGTEKLYEKDAYTLKYDLGVNFVRTAHYSQDPDFFEACDEIGILVEEEALAWNTMPEVARPQFVASIMSMVKRDRNHPSIIFWSIMPNEGTEANYPVEERQAIQEAVKELDHTRLTIQEENHDTFTFVADVYANHDYVVSTSTTPMKEIKRQPYVIGEWNDNLGRVFVSPYDSEVRKIRQVTDDGKKMAYFMQDETIDGIVKWDFNGYLTSLNNYKWGKTHGIYRISGVYGPFKDPMVRYWEADMMKVQTDSSIVGNVVKIMNEWKEDSPEEVYVAANAASVELWKESADGTKTSLGKIAPNYLTDLDQGLFLWTGVTWEAGSKLIAASYDEAGNKLAEDVRYASSYNVPANSEYVLTNATKNEYDSEHYDTYGEAAVEDNLKLQADGSDLVVLMGVLQDENGQKLDYAYENTSFEIVSGPGKLITGPRVYMLGGVNSAYLQSEYGKTGETVVKASVDVGTMVNQDAAELTYSESGWTTIENADYSYEGDYAKSSAQGAWVEMTFTGTQAVLYSHLEYSGYGTGTVTVDGQAAGTINFQRGEDKVGVLDFLPIFETEVLEAGEHTIRITADSGSSITVDALKVFDGIADVTSNELTIVTEALADAEVPCNTELPEAPMKEIIEAEEIEAILAETETYDLEKYVAADALAVTQAVRYAGRVLENEAPSQEELRESRDLLQNALAQLTAVVTGIEYTATSDNIGGTSGFYRYEQVSGTWAGGALSDELYAKKTRTVGDYVSLCFEGTGISLYGKKDSSHGYARVVLTDSQNNTLYDEKIDMYSDTEEFNVLMYENLALEEGTYVIKVMVTGETSGNPNNACVGVSRATVYKDNRGIKADCSTLETKLAEMESVDTTAYSAEIQQAYADALEDAQYLVDHALTVSEEVTLGISILEEAENLLAAEETQLEALLEEAATYDLEQYAAAEALAVKQAVRHAERVLENADSSQEELRESRELLQEALAQLTDVVSGVDYLERADSASAMDGFYCYSQVAGTWTGVEIDDELYAKKTRTVGDYVSLCFEGTGISLYGKKDSNHGYARIVLTDSQNNTLYDEKIDMYAESAEFNVLMYENLTLEEGTYVIKVMVTGETSGNPNNACVGVSRATVYKDGRGEKADCSALEEKLEEMKNVDLSDYSAEIQQAYADALEDAQYLVDHSLTVSEEVALGMSILEEAGQLITIPEEPKMPVTEIFVDVPEGAWYVDSVQYVYDQGILIGDGNIFNPEGATTRAMVAVILYRMAGSPAVTDYTKYNEFNDLPAEHLWYSDAVAWALNEEVSTGDDYNKLYNPNSSVTREQLALFLWRYAKYKEIDVTVNRTEAELLGGTYVNSWAKDGFMWAIDREIIKGSESIGADGQIQYELLPQNGATRAQLARMLQRFCGGTNE